MSAPVATRRDVNTASAGPKPGNSAATGAHIAHGSCGRAHIAGRKSKYSVNALEDEALQAEAVIDLLVNAGDNTVEGKDENDEQEQKLAGSLNLLDVAVSKPLRRSEARACGDVCARLDTLC